MYGSLEKDSDLSEEFKEIVKEISQIGKAQQGIPISSISSKKPFYSEKFVKYTQLGEYSFPPKPDCNNPIVGVSQFGDRRF